MSAIAHLNVGDLANRFRPCALTSLLTKRAAKFANRAPHGREKSARRVHEASAMRTSGRAASGPKRSTSLADRARGIVRLRWPG